MGKHYVPQQHLRRFQIEGKPEFVWMYDKKTGKFSEANVSKVAQNRDYYSEATEKALATGIELPGNVIIGKILDRQSIDYSERAHLALYMMIMATRGPRYRKKAEERYPAVLQEAVEEAHSKVQEWIETKKPSRELAELKLKQVEEAKVKFSQELPPQALEQIRTPFCSFATVECIFKMRWHILAASTGAQYVTCDTPAHMFEWFGLSRPDSEFTFPLSKQFALIGENRGELGIAYEKPNNQLLKEVNRRVLSHCERFAFSSTPEIWIEVVAQNKTPYLSTIRWS